MLCNDSHGMEPVITYANNEETIRWVNTEWSELSFLLHNELTLVGVGPG